MSDTNDTLQNATSAETTAVEQAEGTEGSASVQQTASSEKTEKLYAGKFRSPEDMEKAYLEAQKLIGKKTIDREEASRALGLKTEVVTPTERKEAQTVANDGGPSVQKWFEEAKRVNGEAWAVTKLMEWSAENATRKALANYMAPLNQQLATDAVMRNEERTETAVERLTAKYDDFLDHADDLKKFFADNPKFKDQIDNATTIKDKQEWIETAYLRVAGTSKRTSTAAAKAAGAMDAKVQDKMKAATVTAGSGTRANNTQPASAGDDWLSAMQEFDKGRSLFKS